ncbi:MAG: hypothetical protein D3909_12975, partial [Candidatus Electrothrix sp. ATG1]|nr:hypothetical protein [Candidatus Electrothrix sp. ATG1]
LRHTDDIERVVAGLPDTNRYVLDYFVEEILSHQPTAIQDYLLATSILDRFCAPLCSILQYSIIQSIRLWLNRKAARPAELKPGGRLQVRRKRNFEGPFLGFHLNFETGPECIFISPRYGGLGGLSVGVARLPGASVGNNTNALKHGLYTKEARELLKMRKEAMEML